MICQDVLFRLCLYHRVNQDYSGDGYDFSSRLHTQKSREDQNLEILFQIVFRKASIYIYNDEAYITRNTFELPVCSNQ